MTDATTVTTDPSTSTVTESQDNASTDLVTDAAIETKPTETLTPEPIEYTDFTIPEGSVLDAGVLEDYKVAAKELGLDQAAAQKLIEFGAVAQAKALDKMNNEWINLTVSDKEFGGDKLHENLAIAKKARDAFATPELTALLESTKLGNHPEMIRAFYKIGKALSEDTLVSGSRAPATEQSAAEKLYGNH